MEAGAYIATSQEIAVFCNILQKLNVPNFKKILHFSSLLLYLIICKQYKNIQLAVLLFLVKLQAHVYPVSRFANVE